MPARFAMFVVAAATAAVASAAEMTTTTLAVPAGIAQIEGGTEIIVVDRAGTAFAVAGAAHSPELGRTGKAEPDGPSLPDDILPDGEVISGQNNIALAWLGGPTTRYRHGVLGDAIEASRLHVVDREGRHHALDLDEASVFEDRYPRLADLDGDGRDEIIVVRSYLARGAALAVYGLGENGIAQIAETPPIGVPHRWLNPVGAGDLDGDGRLELAIVVTPHIGGSLRLYDFAEGRLNLIAEESGFSNHAIGTAELGLSAVVDLDGNGRSELAVPSADRRALRIMALEDGVLVERSHIALPVQIRAGVVAGRTGNRPALVVGLANDTVVVIVR